jgi:peptidoglycan/LPS O-acetylase OafA/YrhL
VIYNVQALRAAAAYFVVLAHIGSMFGIAGAAGTALSLGTSGVDLFFVISGFVMVYTTSMQTVSPSEFMARRLSRIAPLYWLLTLVIFAVALLMPSLLASTTASSVALFKSLLFIPYAKPSGEMQPLLFVGWTLNYEMFFYALFALSLLARTSLRSVIACSTAIGALVVGGLIFPNSSPVARFYSSPIMLEFLFGTWVGLAYLYGYRASRTASIALIVVAVVAVVSARLFYPVGERGWWAGIPSALLVYGAICLEARGYAFRNRIIQLQGAASYALYLTHPFLVDAIATASEKIALSSSAAILLALSVLAIIITGVCAVMVHLWVEKPIGSFVHKAMLDRGKTSASTNGVRTRPTLPSGYSTND